MPPPKTQRAPATRTVVESLGRVSEKVNQWVESEAISELGVERPNPTRELRFGGLTNTCHSQTTRGTPTFRPLEACKERFRNLSLALLLRNGFRVRHSEEH